MNPMTTIARPRRRPRHPDTPRVLPLQPPIDIVAFQGHVDVVPAASRGRRAVATFMRSRSRRMVSPAVCTSDGDVSQCPRRVLPVASWHLHALRSTRCAPDATGNLSRRPDTIAAPSRLCHVVKKSLRRTVVVATSQPPCRAGSPPPPPPGDMALSHLHADVIEAACRHRHAVMATSRPQKPWGLLVGVAASTRHRHVLPPGLRAGSSRPPTCVAESRRHVDIDAADGRDRHALATTSQASDVAVPAGWHCPFPRPHGRRAKGQPCSRFPSLGDGGVSSFSSLE